MKLVTYTTDKKNYRLAVAVDETKIIDPQQAYEEKLSETSPHRASELARTLLPEDPTLFLENGEFSLRAADEAVKYALESGTGTGVYKRAEVHIGPPILNPKKIICVGLNYADHIKEMNRELPTHPVVFAKFSNTLMGPNEPFPLRTSLTEKLDYEGELAFVIGKRAYRVSEEEALDYVAGYTVANDITARDMQKRTVQWLQGKTLDKSLPLGPWLVTLDEIKNSQALSIKTSVNGVVRQSSNTANLVFNVNRLVAFLSDFITLEPGDIIITGTPGGVGEAQGLFLQDGDVVKVEIEGIGTIETKIIKED
ncbi:fumarylacetoacetate hydrolase family protein [Psychrobacillus vulpis]|uniref:Fumarylacetoacetate hydrolase family protein n=1 Tax=Psychrobacillus vulpis TaxID=2325572 RepID=A0A544TLW4_9BACI|nr:fumarylacetoacetate hydrolase family protein [Psychrobacillus vulpis]TQR18429.1 fumarylacetoacetate hydrolase family protein [Psychrobacillus vulpis]